MAATQIHKPLLTESPQHGKTLQAAGLKVNNQKTTFIVTDKQTHKAMEKQLGFDDPPIQTVMRDLGIDHQAGRRRRIATLQQRHKKNRQRRVRLRTLRLPTLKTRLRLYRGGVQPVALWGVEAQGLAPRYRQALRHAFSRSPWSPQWRANRCCLRPTQPQIHGPGRPSCPTTHPCLAHTPHALSTRQPTTHRASMEGTSETAQTADLPLLVARMGMDHKQPALLDPP